MSGLSDILANRHSYYRIYSVKKKSGKFRQITEPIGDIIEWHKLAKERLDKVPLHPAAHGFRADRSILTNAELHKAKKYVINIDLKDFFPSVTSFMIFKALTREEEHLDVNDEWDVEKITSLCTLNGCLPQGACTSPVISNIVLKPMDFELKRVADSQELTYTRYADDLTFSGDEIPDWFVNRIRTVAEEFGFKLNDRKIKKMPYFQRQSVTGIVVNNDTLGVSKKTRNQLRQQLHFLGLKGEEMDESMLGILEFIKGVKPSQYESLMRSYRGEYDEGTQGQSALPDDNL